MTFAHAVPWWVMVLGAAGAAALAVWSYWRVRRELGRSPFALLVALRTLALFTLGALLLRPVRVEPVPQSAGEVAVLIDQSASMSLPDEGGRTRFEAAASALQRDLLPALGASFKAEVMGFGERLAPVALATAQPVARESRLDFALRELSQRSRQRPLAGVVVVSDGAVQVDEPDAALADVPVFAIGVGADEPARDREVYGLTAGDARVQGSLVDLSALVVAYGESPARVNVTIEESGRPVDVRRLVLPAAGVPQRLTARVAPSRQSPTVYSVSVNPAEGELTTRNNRQSVLVPPAGDPRRVLIVEGAPAFEHGFLKRALQEDPGLDVDAVVRKGADVAGRETFYVMAGAELAPTLTSGFPSTKAALSRYDVVVLANVEAASLTGEQQRQLEAFVAVRGGGLVVLGGRSFEARGLVGTPLEHVVPLELVDRVGGLARASARSGDPYRVWLTRAGEEHPIMRLGVGLEETREAWSAAPAVAGVAALGEPRPGATLLATTTAPGGVTRPLVAAQRFGRGRAVVFTGEASWRWKMMLPAGDPTYDSFWRQAVRWAGGDAWGPVTVSATSVGPRVLASAEVRDEEFSVARDARTRLRVVGPSGESRDLPVSWGPGARALARAEFDAAESGVHQVVAEARRGTRPLGTASTWTLVGGIDHEFISPRRDDGALRRVAERTGGRVLGLGEMSRLPGLLLEAARRPEQMTERDLWHTPWVFLFIVGLLGVEWTCRRRWGLR